MSGLPRNPPFNPYNVEPAVFAEQVETIGALRNVRHVSLDLVEKWISGSPPDAGSFVSLTFDDVWRHLLPMAELLNKNGMTAAFFVPTGYVGSDVYSFSGFDRWCSALPESKSEWYRPVSLPDIHRLLALGMFVQPHGHQHLSLGNVPPDEMKRDLASSVAFFRDALATRVFALCYPFGSPHLGDVTEEVIQCAAELGISIGFSTKIGNSSFEELRRNPLCLRRIIVNDYDRGILIEAKASGYCGPLPLLKMVLHGYKRHHPRSQ